MSNILLAISNAVAPQTCLWGFVCANETFISIYGVIFTIVISLGVYIYGLQDKSEKITLLKNTNIKKVITNCLGFFALSFIAFPSPFYEFVNFILVASLLLSIFDSFKEVFKFNENELSGERAVRKFKEGVIQEKLVAFEELKIKNDALTKTLQDKNIERFLLRDNDDSYNLIRSQKTGFITNVDLEILFSGEINSKTTGLKDPSYYIPYSIASGNQIGFDDVILGIKKEEKGTNTNLVNYDNLRSFISIKDEFDNPLSYLQAEIRSYYPEMFSFITLGNSKALELKLEEFSKFVNLLIKKTDSYSEIIQFINDDIIFPLQKYAFKNGDVDTIRKITSFSLQYLYESVHNKLIQTFNIFLRNLSNAFYESSKMAEKSSRDDFHEVYFRWFSELSKYSIKPKLQKNDSSYSEYAIAILSATNGMLKIAFDNKDEDLLNKTLFFLNNSFVRDSYEHEELPVLEEIITTKKAVIFGFTSWVYKYYEQRKNDPFYKTALNQLFLALRKENFYHYSNIPDDLNYYLATYIKASEISDKSSFSWDTWGMPEGRVYTITIRGDLKNLLIDRLLDVTVKNKDLEIQVKGKNYNDELALLKENSEFDPFKNKTLESFYSTSGITEDEFGVVKSKVHSIFKIISEKYDEDVRINLIEQPLDEAKFTNFGKENFNSYAKSRVMFRISNFIKDSVKRKSGFGYNILLHKEQFVVETNIHYTNDDQFGENLARSEDNKILEAIYKKFTKIPPLAKEKIGEVVSKNKNIKSIVLWTNNYFNIQDTNQGNFRPHWQDQGSKMDKGSYYQGSLDGVDVYMVYRFDEHKSYPDTLFAFEKEAFSMKEFELEMEPIDNVQTKIFNGNDTSVHLSVTNLSDLEDERVKIVEKWISDDPTEVIDKDAKITELKTNVVFKFFKGIDTEDLSVNQDKVKIFELR